MGSVVLVWGLSLRGCAGGCVVVFIIWALYVGFGLVCLLVFAVYYFVLGFGCRFVDFLSFVLGFVVGCVATFCCCLYVGGGFYVLLIFCLSAKVW